MFLRPHPISESPSRPLFPSAVFRSLNCARFSRPISALHGRNRTVTGGFHRHLTHILHPYRKGAPSLISPSASSGRGTREEISKSRFSGHLIRNRLKWLLACSYLTSTPVVSVTASEPSASRTRTLVWASYNPTISLVVPGEAFWLNVSVSASTMYSPARQPVVGR